MASDGPATAGHRVARLLAGRLDQAKVEHLHEVIGESQPPHMNVRRLDVAMDQARGVGLGERLADLAENVDDASRRERALARHQGLEGHAVEQLHDEIHRLVVGDAEVVELDGVRRAEAGRGLGLAAKALHGKPRRLATAFPDHFRTNELDRRRAREHAMGGAVHLPHAAAADELPDLVAAHFAGLDHLLPEPADDARDHDGDARRGDSRRSA